MLRIAKGTIVEKTPVVHGYPFTEDDEKVLISELTNEECTHPDNEYSLEEGGFCTWKRVDIKKTLTLYVSLVFSAIVALSNIICFDEVRCA